MKCFQCNNICQGRFLEMKEVNEAGTKIEILSRLCYDCIKIFLLDLFIEELKKGALDEYLKEYR